MKSIIEEASSISKAIEKGWLRAGKPKNFSIKVYEESEKNFFGLTTKSAKVAIIFDEKTVVATPEKTVQTSNHGHQKTEQKRAQSSKQQSVKAVSPEQKPKDNRRQQSPKNAPEKNTETVQVSDEIKQAVTSWLDSALPVMNIHNAVFRLESTDDTIQITFDTSLITDSHEERAFLKSLSYLALATLRNKFKKGLRGLKLVFAKKRE